MAGVEFDDPTGPAGELALQAGRGAPVLGAHEVGGGHVVPRQPRRPAARSPGRSAGRGEPAPASGRLRRSPPGTCPRAARGGPRTCRRRGRRPKTGRGCHRRTPTGSARPRAGSWRSAPDGAPSRPPRPLPRSRCRRSCGRPRWWVRRRPAVPAARWRRLRSAPSHRPLSARPPRRSSAAPGTRWPPPRSRSSPAARCHHHDPSRTHAPCTNTTLIATSPAVSWLRPNRQ